MALWRSPVRSRLAPPSLSLPRLLDASQKNLMTDQWVDCVIGTDAKCSNFMSEVKCEPDTSGFDLVRCHGSKAALRFQPRSARQRCAMPTLSRRVAGMPGILVPEMLAKRIVLVRARARLVPMIALLLPGFSIAQEDAAISPLRATTLSGVEVLVPDPERAAVLVVGFGRAAARQVRLWRRYIDGIDSAPSVASVLVIDDMPRITRGVLTRMMRGEVSEERQDTIYVVTEDGVAWRDLVQIDETNVAADAYVLRFDGTGQVCFRHVGPVTDAAASALLAADCGLGVGREAAEQLSD